LQVAQLHNMRAQARGQLGDVSGAVADMQRSLELRREMLGPDHPTVAAALNNVALWEKAQGKYDDALASARQALAIMERRAAVHPHFAFTLHTLGLMLAAKGEDAEALVHLERALPLLRKIKGEDDADIADLLNSIGFSLRAVGRREEALARHQEALVIVERRLGPDHPATADTRVSMGLALASLERVDEADAAYRRALRSYEMNLPPMSPRLGVLLNNIGELANRRHAYKDALDACTRAVAIDEHNVGADHPDVAYDLMCVAAAQEGLHRIAPAIATNERVVRLLETAGGDPADLATARADLARVRRMAE
jgi:eukaryotic-like serine/threonine-protein kinase